MQTQQPHYYQPHHEHEHDVDPPKAAVFSSFVVSTGYFVLFFCSVATAMLLAAATTTNWVIINEAPSQHVMIRMGIMHTCRDSACDPADFSTFSSCGRSTSALKGRYSMVGGAVGIALFMFIFALVVVAVTAPHLVAINDFVFRLVDFERELADENPVTPPKEHDVAKLNRLIKQNLKLAVHTNRMMVAALAIVFVGVFFDIIAVALYNDTTESYVHCGKSICTIVIENAGGANSGVNCGFGSSFHLATTSCVVACVLFLLCLTWFVLFRKQYHRIHVYLAGSDFVEEPLEEEMVEGANPPAAAVVYGAREPLVSSSVAPQAQPTANVPQQKSKQGPSQWRRAMHQQHGDQRGEKAAPYRPSHEVLHQTAHAPHDLDPAHDHPVRSSSQQSGQAARLVVVQQEIFDDEPAQAQGSAAVAGDDEWVFSEEAQMYWSEPQRLYFDDNTKYFYDPRTDCWYDPERDEWFRTAAT